MSAPTVSTSSASSIAMRSAAGNGNITSTGGSSVTRRGFQYNTTPYEDREVYEDGSFSTGAYSLTINGLTPGSTYYVRAFATNVDGTNYGSWVSFTAVAPTYTITIDGEDRTEDVVNRSLLINDIINDEQNTCSFSLFDRSGLGMPENDEEIRIVLNDGTTIFGGYIVSFQLSKKSTGAVTGLYSAVDYVRLLDRNLVHKSYESMTDAEIIEDIIATYCPGFGITTTNVIAGATIDQISFNYVQPSQALRRICDLTGRNWFIDYDKDIHYFPLTTTSAPFDIDSSNYEYEDLQISKDASQIKNRVYVRGGTKLSDFTTYSEKGDGQKRKFVLPDRPHDVSVTVNGISKTVGIKNVNLSGFDFYLNFQEKYLEQDSGGSTLASTDTLEVEYKYDIPILVAVEDSDSILEHGQHEFAIFDKSITTTQAARDRAGAELTDYANNIVEATFRTFTPGFKSGQYLNVDLTSYGISDDYLVQKVVARGMGAGLYYYEISLASSKTMGIIRFLIELLEANKNLIELDDDEVVDELLTVFDQLLSDSLIDSLVTDSAGPYATWCTDSLQSTPTTRARWDLFQWG